MQTYKILLVDDEEEVCQVMIKKIDWDGLGFQVVGYARNGLEALEMAEELEPDVVMTDIKMPYMDGLTLCRKLKERYGSMKVIILSGFDEFEYAKEAIRIEAEEYLLKPINATEVNDIIAKMKLTIDKELDEKRNIDKLQEYYQKSLPIIQQQFYIGLMEGSIPQKQMQTYRSMYQISDDKLEQTGKLCVTVIESESDQKKESQGRLKLDIELRRVSLNKLIEEELEKKWNCKVFSYLGKTILICALGEEKGDCCMEGYISALSRIKRIAARVLQLNIIAGIGWVCDQLGQIGHSYKGALEALNYHVIYNDSNVIPIAEIEPEGKEEFIYSHQDIENITRMIKVGEQDELQEAIRAFVDKLSRAKVSIAQFRISVMSFVTELSKLGMSYEISLEELFEQEDVYQKIQTFNSLEEMEEWMLDVCLKARKNIRKERVDSAKLLVDKAIAYLQENYQNQELAVESICAYLNVSSAYFSTIFKKETGKTFVNYLTDLRMEVATELLNTTEDKTYMISEKIGYADPNYFSYVFKKHFGISPSKYRTSQNAD